MQIKKCIILLLLVIFLLPYPLEAKRKKKYKKRYKRRKKTHKVIKKDPEKYTPKLIFALQSMDVRRAKHAIERGADVNAKDEDEWPLFILAVTSGSPEMVELFLENRVRLGIMSALMVNNSLDFNTLKELLGVTDGNLASHLKALEKGDLVKIQKQFIGRKPNTKYIASEKGKIVFKEHLDALEKLINR